MFSLRKREAALQDFWELVPDGRVASLDYTQLQQSAASDGLNNPQQPRGKPRHLLLEAAYNPSAGLLH